MIEQPLWNKTKKSVRKQKKKVKRTLLKTDYACNMKY